MRVLAATLHDLLRTARLPTHARLDLLRRMGSPRRHYHGLDHLAALWVRHKRYGLGTPFVSRRLSRLIACAILFHDAVYDPIRTDNEARSAGLWEKSAPADLPQRDVVWVANTIRATADHLAPRPARTLRQRARRWMLDLDLTPLGDEPELFDRNTRALRTEYRHLPDAEWERQRTAFLHKLQTAPGLYHSHPIAAVFASRARRNLAREVGALWDCGA
jgi:predicted metal-dependent HD superfamily phosphohydrolase